MRVFNQRSGAIMLSDTFTVKAEMKREQLLDGYNAMTGNDVPLDAQADETVLPLPAFSAGEELLAGLCYFQEEKLHTIELTVMHGSAAQQRALLFDFIGIADPCPETMQDVLVRYPFGSASIATDSCSGDAVLRLIYTFKE